MIDGQGVTDGELVRRVLAGDREQFGVLVERYRQDFARYAASVTGDADLAADAMQDAFIRAYDALADCREPDRFKAWFFRILTNRCHTVRGRRKREVPFDIPDPPARERTEARAENRETMALVNAALAELTEEQREAFVLKHVEERSYEEISELTGVGVDALKMRVYRAREMLRRRLEERL